MVADLLSGQIQRKAVQIEQQRMPRPFDPFEILLFQRGKRHDPEACTSCAGVPTCASGRIRCCWTGLHDILSFQKKNGINLTSSKGDVKIRLQAQFARRLPCPNTVEKRNEKASKFKRETLLIFSISCCERSNGLGFCAILPPPKLLRDSQTTQDTAFAVEGVSSFKFWRWVVGEKGLSGVCFSDSPLIRFDLENGIMHFKSRSSSGRGFSENFSPRKNRFQRQPLYFPWGLLHSTIW